MYSKVKMVRVITATLALTIGLGACVKQRPERISQGDEKYETITQESPTINKLWTLSSDAKTFAKSTEYKIRTGNVLIPSQNSIAEKLIVEPESGLKFMNVMNFSSDHPLLEGKAELAYMLGEPNKVYSVMEELTPTHLIIYKVVSNDELGFNEKTFAIRDGVNWRVPVGGYTVTYVKKEKVRNEDNRDTNTFTYYSLPAQEYKQATHYQVNKYGFIPFDRFVKSDVLEKSFFDGEWYFTETTVDVSFDRGAAVGDLGGSDSNFSSATRIRFKIFDDQLVAQNTNIDEDFKDDPNSLNYGTVLKIKIDHRDFRWIREGNDALKEIEEDTKEKVSKRFIKLYYLESDTPQLSIESILGSLFGKINNFRNVLDVTYGKDYFSYSIRDAQTQMIKRYSMRKIDPKSQIQPRQAFKKDNQLFGTFVTQKYKKLDYKIAQQEDIEKLLIMARHNPNKDIVYYFTDRTPKEKWYRDIGREAINMWAQAFKKAGLKITVKLNEEKDVALGDIRYNVLNIVKRAGAGLLGFGPSLIDSETGEIVSASMNTGIENVIAQYYRVTRNYLGRKSGRTYNFKNDEENTELPGILSLIAKVNSHQYRLDSTSGQLMMDGQTHLNPAVFTDKEKEFLNYFKISPSSSIQEFVTKINELRLHSYRYANVGGLFNLSVFSADDAFTSTMVLDGVIEKNCPEVVKLAKKMETELVSTPDEIQIIEPCVKLLAQGEAVLTTVHELGHNLSLRHNFKGSVDKANFPDVVNGSPNGYTLKHIKLADGVAKPMTSSIMEYVTQEGQQVMPGLYDVAAIRWIYDGKVEKKDGTIAKLDTNKEIISQVSKDQLKPFEFCTDEHRILVTDPMCNSFDQGSTVKESVRFQIEQVYNALGSAYRYNKVSAGAPVISLITNGMSLKAKYDKWRGFLRKFTGSNKSYLQDYNMQSYAALMQKIASNPADAAVLKEHLEVRNMIVRFLVDLAFISNKYCVVIDSDKEEKLIELEKIRKELFGAGEYTVINSCKSPAAKKYLDDQKLTLVKEFGHFLDQGQFDLDPSRTLEPMDFSGTAGVRTWAVALLTWRTIPFTGLGGFSSISNAIEGFAPNMMDEPDVRQYVQTLILDRLVNGVRVAQKNSKSEYAIPKADLFGKADIEKVFNNKAYTNFNNETGLIQAFTQFIKLDLSIPGSTVDDGRMANISTNWLGLDQAEFVKQNAANYIAYSNGYLFVTNNNSFAGQIMSQFKAVSEKKDLVSAVTPDQLLQAKADVIKNIQPVLFQPPKIATLADLLKIYDFLNAVIPQLQQNPGGQPIVFGLIQIFDPELQVLNMIAQSLAAQGINLTDVPKMLESQDQAQKDMATQILATPLGPAYAQLQKQDPTILMPSAGVMAQRYDKMVQNHTALYKNFTKSAEEFDSQINLLQDVLQILRR